MLINFSFSNWRSFRDEATLSMIATREKRHAGHLAHIPTLGQGKTPFRLLPLAAMYGGNASGKSNFVRALEFMRDTVIYGSERGERIPIDPWVGKGSNDVVRFSIQFLINDTAYTYEFVVSAHRVLKESLGIITKTGQEKPLFSRNEEGRFAFFRALSKDLGYFKAQARAVPDEQLFLCHINHLKEKTEILESVWKWFEEGLFIIFPNSKFAWEDFLFGESNYLRDAMNQAYKELDTGIAELKGEPVPVEQHPMRDVLEKKLQRITGDIAVLGLKPPGMLFRGLDVPCKRIDGRWHVMERKTLHQDSEGGKILFDFDQESDGSRRLFDLLPALLSNMPATYVIDEIDRSLHPLLTRRLLEIFLSRRTPESRSQVILTTHDATLLDQDLLRRDEVWVAERDADGASTLFSFSDFKEVRSDKDIRKSYLQGRMGGVPKLRFSGVHCLPEKDNGDG